MFCISKIISVNNLPFVKPIKIRNKLEHYGFNFSNKQDTKIIMELFYKFVENFIKYSNGILCFLLYHIQKIIIFCSSYIFGVNSLYYKLFKDIIYLGSEIKQLFKKKKNVFDIINFLS